jgi:Recombinase
MFCPPRSREGKRSTWCPTAIRAILKRELYKGERIWNKSQFRKFPGANNRRRKPRPESQRTRIPLPELAIVSEELWNEVQVRLNSFAEIRTSPVNSPKCDNVRKNSEGKFAPFWRWQRKLKTSTERQQDTFSKKLLSATQCSGTERMYSGWMEVPDVMNSRNAGGITSPERGSEATIHRFRLPPSRCRAGRRPSSSRLAGRSRQRLMTSR